MGELDGRQPAAHRADLRAALGQRREVAGDGWRRCRQRVDVAVLGAPGGELPPVRAVATRSMFAARAAST